jgi:hypothetical protein
MTTTAFDDRHLAAPEPVRQPYSTEAILRRNIADMEVALKQQTERAERAAVELAKLREQKPVMKYMGRRLTPKDTMESWGIDCDVNVRPEMGTPLYAVPVPAPHKGATHCDGCGLTWLDDGLNPLWCPYCRDAVTAPAVPSAMFVAHNRTSSVLFAARKDADRYAASFGPTAGVSVTECVVIGPHSSPQAPAVPSDAEKLMQILSEPAP